MLHLIWIILTESWHLLVESSVYILFGLGISGLLKVFLNQNSVSRHLGHGRFKSVFKAAFLGIPIPLCSCGVLPAAVSLRKQGANRGATTAFLISTPESGVDSIAITYALMDPLMTLARPLVAFFTAALAKFSGPRGRAPHHYRGSKLSSGCLLRRPGLHPRCPWETSHLC